MKKHLAVFLLILVLAGCGSVETFETIQDDLVAEAAVQLPSVQLELPEDAAVMTLAGENRTLYLCDGYDIGVEVRKAGDLNQTVRDITGFDMEELTVIKTRHNGMDRWSLIWCTAGENGSRLGRGMILNDDRCHYIVYGIADEENTGKLEEVWDQLSDSAVLA